MRRTPPNLFSSLLTNPTADFTLQEAQSFFDSYLSCFSDLGLLMPGSPRNWTQCLNCGQSHELTDIGGVYWLSCPYDDVEAVAINADQLKTIRFSHHKFYSWLQSQFSLQGNIEASNGKAILGQGMVNGTKRLFIFSHDGSPQAREKLYQEHPANQAVIVYLNPTLDSHKGYDINLAEYLVVQDNSLSIDTSSALGVIEDTIPQLAGDPQASSSYAVELKLVDDKIVLTGTVLGGSYPAFKAKKKRSTAISRLLRTLLKLHKDDKETTSQTYKQSILEANYIDPRKNKQNDLAQIDLTQDKRPLSELCSLLLPYLFTHRHHKDDGLVIEFKSALSQADWNGLSDQEKQKILASKAE